MQLSKSGKILMDQEICFWDSRALKSLREQPTWLQCVSDMPVYHREAVKSRYQCKQLSNMFVRGGPSVLEKT